MAGAMDVGTVGASTFSSGIFVGVVRDDDEQRVFCVHHLCSLLLWFVSTCPP